MIQCYVASSAVVGWCQLDKRALYIDHLQNKLTTVHHDSKALRLQLLVV